MASIVRKLESIDMSVSIVSPCRGIFSYPIRCSGMVCRCTDAWYLRVRRYYVWKIPEMEVGLSRGWADRLSLGNCFSRNVGNLYQGDDGMILP